jgi:hypothetical protein
LTRIELTQWGNAVSQLRFALQVFPKDGIYDPVVAPAPKNGNLVCWPDAPLWKQIKDGDCLSREHLDLESYRCSQQVDEITLRHGKDFDEVLLAIPLGAFKKLNDAPGPCDELIAASERFRAMTENLTLVPSLSVQAWCTRDLRELGWPPAGTGVLTRGTVERPAISTGPSPLDIWADMSQVLKFENWDPHPRGPKSVHYF